MAYQKINWEDLPSTNTPITADNLNHMEGGIEQVDNDIDEVYNNIGDLSNLNTADNTNLVSAINSMFSIKLWENPNENTSFSSQDVSIQNLSDYEMIEIFAKNYGSSSYKNLVSVRIINGYNGYLCVIETNGGIINRQATVDWVNNKVTFEDAKFKDVNATSASVVNARAVPVFIIGYKIFFS